MHTLKEEVVKLTDHSHAPDVREEDVNNILLEMRVEAKSSTNSTRTVLVNAHNKVRSKPIALKLPTSKALSNRIRRARKKMNLGSVTPTSLHELRFEHVHTISNSEKQFLLYDSGPGDSRIVMYSTAENLDFLSFCEDWYMDGTFDVCPPLFSQVYTIHGNELLRLLCFNILLITFVHSGKRFGAYVPLVYILASHKDYETYRTIFEQLKVNKPSLSPKHIMVDFEQAAINAASNEFPGCFFHFTQCIWRKIQNLGLQTKYNSDPVFALNMRKLAALAFVPVEKVSDSFQKLKKILKVRPRPKANSEAFKLKQLLDYFELTWVGKKNVRAKFPIKLWNMFLFTLNGSPRTNNAVEGWHNAINRFVGCVHPSLWYFIRKMKDEQGSQEVKITQLIQNNGVSRRQKYMKHDENLLKLVKNYSSDENMYTLEEYLSNIAHNLSY